MQAPRTLWAQGNSVEELENGDILASYRPTSTVVRISRSTGKILWKLGPPTVAVQHAPTRLANGNILIFDNGVHRLDDSLPYSRVTEVGPATNRIVWKYQDKPAWNFFSPRMGNVVRSTVRGDKRRGDRLGTHQSGFWRAVLRWTAGITKQSGFPVISVRR